MWVGRSVAAVKLPQALLPAAWIMMTLFSASHPGLVLDFFAWTSLASYGAIQQKESWMPVASYGTERGNSKSFCYIIVDEADIDVQLY